MVSYLTPAFAFQLMTEQADKTGDSGTVSYPLACWEIIGVFESRADGRIQVGYKHRGKETRVFSSKKQSYFVECERIHIPIEGENAWEPLKQWKGKNKGKPFLVSGNGTIYPKYKEQLYILVLVKKDTKNC